MSRRVGDGHDGGGSRVTEQRLPATRPEFAAVVSEQLARRSLALVEGAAPRILPFPLDRSLGEVYLVDKAGKRASVEPYAEARGNVVLPPGAYVGMVFAALETVDADLAALPLRELTPVCPEINLLSTQVTDAGLWALAGLANLQILDLADTAITDEGLAALAELTNLKNLDLSLTNVTDVGLWDLAGLTNLRDLWLNFTQVTDEGLAALGGLTNLRSLYLIGTAVTDEGLEALAGLTNLRELFLSDTAVTDAGLAALAGLTSLRALHLQNTAVTDEGVAALKSRLRGVLVSRKSW